MTHLFLFPALFLTACASAPLPLSSSHPASAEAAEGISPAPLVLRADGDTRRTRALLADRAQQARAAAAEPPGHDHP